MTIGKLYKSLKKKQSGIYKGVEYNEEMGKNMHIVEVTREDGSVELVPVSQSTFKRWWRLAETQEVVTPVQTIQQIEEIFNVEPVVEETVVEEPMVEEESVVEEVVEQVVELPTEKPVEEKQQQKVEPKVRKKEMSDVAKYLKDVVEDLGGVFHTYAEQREGVVKFKGKPIMFFGFVKDGIRLYLKDQLDEMLGCPYPVEEKHSYPKQYPFRVVIPELTERNQELLQDILHLYI